MNEQSSSTAFQTRDGLKYPKLSKRVQGQIVADSTTQSTKLVSSWMLAAGGETLSAMQEIRRLVGTGAIATVARHRFAEVSTKRPGPWITSVAERTAQGIYVDSVSLTGTTNQLWVQVALAAKQTKCRYRSRPNDNS